MTNNTINNAAMTNQEKKDLDNRNTCKRIADELDAIAAGLVYRCPECGELIEWDNDQYNNDERTYTCPNCRKTFEENELEPIAMYDYFADAFDIEYRIGSDREYRSVQVMVACGGPNIYVDTERKSVDLYWLGDRASYLLQPNTVYAIDECFSELFNM